MKFLLLSTLIFSFFTPSNSQLIDITVCTDNSCKSNCVSWTATNNECAVCTNSQCSVTNPSAKIQNMNSITFYTDTKCLNHNIVSGTSSIPITLDNSCHLLHDNNMNIIGSYNASNKSALRSFLEVFNPSITRSRLKYWNAQGLELMPFFGRIIVLRNSSPIMAMFCETLNGKFS